MPIDIGGTIWPTALASALDYKSIIKTGLVLHLDPKVAESYPGSGTSWYDLSGNGNHGTLINGPGYNSANGGSIVFDGTNDYVNNSSFSGHQTSAGTISLWAYPTTTSGEFYAIAAGGTTTYGASRAIRLWNGFWGAVNYGSSNEDFNNIVAADANTWVNIVYVWNGTNITYYKNAVSYSGTKNLLTPAGTTLNIGTTAWSLAAFWPGRISNVYIYNRALTAQEIAHNFNATRDRYGI